MSEFKFACPVCTQHIRCDTSQTGSVMSCPTCFQKIIVPLAPVSDESKIVVTGQKYIEKKTEPAAAAPEPTPTRSSPALIAGVLIALAALGGGVAYWLLHHHPPAASDNSPLAAITNAIPGASAVKKPVVVIPPANDTNWNLTLGPGAIPAIPAAGRIHGLDFLAERSTFQNGLLTFRSGTHGPLENAIQINFAGAAPETLAGKTINIAADTDKAAEVILRWKPEGKGQKETYDSGYALHLEFGALANNRLPGKIHLCLPDPEKSYLLGTFTADAHKPKPKPAVPGK